MGGWPVDPKWVVLKALDVFEVSPVIRGAGINTRTEEAKERQVLEEVRRIRDQLLGTSGAPNTDAKQAALEEARRIRAQFLASPGRRRSSLGRARLLPYVRGQVAATSGETLAMTAARITGSTAAVALNSAAAPVSA